MILTRLLSLLGLLAALLSSCASSTPQMQQTPVDMPLGLDSSWADIGPNDVVRVTVWGHPEASTRAEGEKVDPAGFLSLPLIGAVQVAGLTADQARLSIAAQYAQFIRDPQIGLTVLDSGSREFYVLGHVEGPGAFDLDRPLTALQGLAHGGSFIVGAARHEVLLLRPMGVQMGVHTFNAEEPDLAGLVALKPGDILFVPRSGHGKFREDILPYIQGLGFLSQVPNAAIEVAPYVF